MGSIPGWASIPSIPPPPFFFPLLSLVSERRYQCLLTMRWQLQPREFQVCTRYAIAVGRGEHLSWCDYAEIYQRWGLIKVGNSTLWLLALLGKATSASHGNSVVFCLPVCLFLFVCLFVFDFFTER